MRTGRPSRLRGVVLGLAALVVLVLPQAPALAQQPGLESARRATAAYHDLDRALAAGYQKFLPCFDDPSAGGMGQHYVNFGLLDGTVDAAAPEALVYEVAPSGERLVAVEYLVPYTAVPSTAPPPTLFGAAFSRHDDLGVWALHAWIWRPNPAGMHADFNPRVAACPHG
jgi:hypothetical protein